MFIVGLLSGASPWRTLILPLLIAIGLPIALLTGNEALWDLYQPSWHANWCYHYAEINVRYCQNYFVKNVLFFLTIR